MRRPGTCNIADKETTDRHMPVTLNFQGHLGVLQIVLYVAQHNGARTCRPADANQSSRDATFTSYFLLLFLDYPFCDSQNCSSLDW